MENGASVATALGDAALLAALREAEVARRRAYARELALLAEVDARGLAAERGYGATAALVRDMFSLNPGQVRRLVADAAALSGSVSPSGARVEPELPRVGAALCDGAIGPEHVEAIRTALRTLPSRASTEDKAAAEEILVAAAPTTEPRLLARLGREIRARLDPDGDAPGGDDLTRPERSLDLRRRDDGGVDGRFRLDPESGALLTGLLSPLAAPRADETGRDPRGVTERQGDALAEVLRLAARCPDTPAEAGEPVTLFVSATLDELRQGIGQGLVDGYLNLSVAQIRRMACDCAAAPVIFGNTGEPLDIGRATRIVPRRIRRALILRDRGCCFPGCDRKPKWCDAHHLVTWLDGGPTALWNLALLCPFHHRLVHHTDWTIHMIDGTPWFTPPSHVDPERQPRRNTIHTLGRELPVHDPGHKPTRQSSRKPPVPACAPGTRDPWAHTTPIKT